MVAAGRLALLVLLVLALAAGCGGGGGDGGGEGELTIMLPSDNPGDIELRRKQARAFMEDNPDIEVKVTLVPAEGYNEKVATAIAGGTPPDLFVSGDVQIPTIVQKGYAVDLNEFIEEEDYDMSDFAPELIDGLTFDGKLVGLTDNWDAQALYYNRTMFEEAGVEPPTADWTWEDFVSAARALTSGEGKDKVYGAVIDPWFGPVYSQIWAFGGDVFSEDGTECLLDSPESVAGVESITDLFEQGIAPSTEQLGSLGQDSTQMFLAGRAAMVIGSGRWLAFELAEVEKFEWAVAALPQGPAGRAPFFHVGLFAIARSSDNPEAAWDFLKFITSPEGIRMGTDNFQGIPARQSLADDPEFSEAPFVVEHDAYEPFVASLPDVHKAPYVENFTRLQDRIDSGWETVWSLKTPAEEALTKTCGEVESELQAAAG
jgi:multiple sugar transport system substrate-binding protein